MATFAILGAGNWGTALAIHAARAGHDVRLWTRDADLAKRINAGNADLDRFPDAIPREAVRAESDPGRALSGADFVLLAVPAQSIRGLIRTVHAQIEARAIMVCASKGIEAETGKRMSEVCAEEHAGLHGAFVCLSGPSFADEVAQGHPTAIVASSIEPVFAERVQHELSSSNLRIYTNGDLVGTELGGAVKNVMAIAAGMVTGLDFGSNTLAALITRGLAEITRFSIAKGATAETMTGLSGLGDLVLTCTGTLSRNRYVGEQLGKGYKLAEILSGMREVAEGVPTAAAVKKMATACGVEMPICGTVYDVLYNEVDPRHAIQDLMSRPLKGE